MENSSVACIAIQSHTRVNASVVWWLADIQVGGLSVLIRFGDRLQKGD